MSALHRFRPGFVAGLLILAAGTAAAQSPLALTNIGADIRSSDARIDGRGGWGLAESDTLTPSFHSLAGLAGLRSVAIVVSGYGERVDSKDAYGGRTTHRVRTPNLRAAMPFRGGDLVLSAGFRSLRATQYDMTIDREFLLPDPDDPLSGEFVWDGSEEIVREGTQFEVPLGLSWRPHEKLALGASLNIVGGVIRERVNLIYDEPSTSSGSNYYLTTAETLEEEIDGVSSTWSVLVDPLPNLSVGATYTTAHDWDVARTHDMTGIPGSVVSDYVLEIPETWGVGLAYDLAGRWRVGAEYEAQPFSKLTGREDWEPLMVDAWRVGFGIDRAEAYRRHGGRSNLPLRLGFSMQRWPYLVQNDEVIERRVSAGTGFSFRDRSGHLDLALSYAWTGKLDTNGARDRSWRFTVSVAGLEKWW